MERKMERLYLESYDETSDDYFIQTKEKIKRTKSTFSDRDKPNKKVKRNKKKTTNGMKRFDADMLGSFDD
jgi:hypothetical protein